MTLNLAPMVDVMMCLIIFFLLASKLAGEFPIELPWARAATVVEETDLGNRVTLTVRRADNADERAEYVVWEWDGRQVTERLLQPAEVVSLLKARAGQATRDRQPLRCVIRADRDVMYQHVEVVLRACGVAQVSDIVFSVNAGEAPGGPA
jgi:biopolymer transport protein ExbD